MSCLSHPCPCCSIEPDCKWKQNEHQRRDDEDGTKQLRKIAEQSWVKQNQSPQHEDTQDDRNGKYEANEFQNFSRKGVVTGRGGLLPNRETDDLQQRDDQQRPEDEPPQ